MPMGPDSSGSLSMSRSMVSRCSAPMARRWCGHPIAMRRRPARPTCSSLTGNDNPPESNVSDGAVMMIGLRLIHIVSGVFWAGTVMVIAWFLLPTAQALGQPGGAFMQRLMFQQRLRTFMLGSMLLTILSGLTMYGWIAMETNGMWARSKMGMVIGVGAIAAIIAGGIGGGVVGRQSRKMMELGGRIQASGGPPTDAQKAEMDSYQRKIRSAFQIIAVLVVIATITMASARYLSSW